MSARRPGSRPPHGGARQPQNGRRPTNAPRRTSGSAAASARRRRPATPAQPGKASGDTTGPKIPVSAKPASTPRTHAPSRPESNRPSTSADSARTAGTAGSADTAQSTPKSRFNTQWNIVFHGEDRTHSFSLRMAAVVMFLAIGLLIVATPLNRYMAQQEEKREVVADLAQTEERVKELERELDLWKDDNYVQSQARERLGYVKPGQTLYIVADPDEGTAEEVLADRVAEVNEGRLAATPFYMTMWDSLQIAGQVGEYDNPSQVPVLREPAPSAEPSGEATAEPNANPSATGEPADTTEPAETDVAPKENE